MERSGMSQAERDRLEWLKRARDGLVTQRQAAEKMGVTDRRVRQMLGELEKRGDAVVVHRLRGRPSNRKIDKQIQQKALEVLKQAEWHDFGPTFASEQLAKRHGIEVSKETLRAWMIVAGIWKSQASKIGDVHVWRPRRSCAGELVQGYVDARVAGGPRGAGAVLRLAQVKTLAAGNAFLEKEYWPEWNERYALPLSSVTNLHRPLAPELDLASILSHVESRVIAPNYTVPFQGRHYHVDPAGDAPARLVSAGAVLDPE